MVKKIVKKVMVPKYIEVQSDEFKEVIEYETFDGTLFRRKEEAQEYEDKIKAEEIPNINYEIFTIGDNWYRPKNEEQVELLKRKLMKYTQIDSFSVDKIKAGVWINTYYDYGGDNYPDIYKIITLDEYLKDVEFLKNRLNIKEMENE